MNMNQKDTACSGCSEESALKIVMLGGSSGALHPLACILGGLPDDFSLPVFVVNHLHADDNGGFAEYLGMLTSLSVIEPCDKTPMEAGVVYVAPANYHMLLEADGLISLSVDEKVNWSRPSIDVFFESAAVARGEDIVGIILSGANADGARGMMAIRQAGGLTIAQSPDEAESPTMPLAAINTGAVCEVLRADEIVKRLLGIGAA